MAPKGGQTSLVLASAADFGRQARVDESVDLTFATDDVHGLHDRLTALGVTMTSPETQSFGTFIKVTRPDGHTFVVSDLS
ncbi:MAG: hypothetical protein ACRDP6_13005 [Actinoallomurus sp.]